MNEAKKKSDLRKIWIFTILMMVTIVVCCQLLSPIDWIIATAWLSFLLSTWTIIYKVCEVKMRCEE